MTHRKYSFFPKKLAQVVEPLTRPLFKAQGLAGTRLLTDWEHIVGPELARRSAPQKLSFPQGKTTGGTLTVAVENGFSTDVQYMQPAILERLAAYFGYQAVNRIVIGQARLPATEAPPEPKTPRAVLPAASAQAADGVEDEELKNALKSLANTLSGTVS